MWTKQEVEITVKGLGKNDQHFFLLFSDMTFTDQTTQLIDKIYILINNVTNHQLQPLIMDLVCLKTMKMS